MEEAFESKTVRVEARDLQELFDALAGHHYRIYGPTVQNRAIVYDEISRASELPIGYGDEQEKGLYRIFERGDSAFFGFNVGPQSWKRFLFRPRERLAQVSREPGGFEFTPEPVDDGTVEKKAFIGVRACEIQAIAVQDRVFMNGFYSPAHPYQEEYYARQREGVLIIAVQCTRSAATCFCASMQSGPEVKWGYDIVMTEVVGDGEHYFLCASGSKEGRRILAGVSQRIAGALECETGQSQVTAAEHAQIRRLPTEEFPGLLMKNFEHPRWEEVAERCLSCANCTLVCPTCFCSTVEDVTDIDGTYAERWRRWDSCFNLDHSYLHGGSVRSTVKSRYRQWLTHKLDTWIDQFGLSGCVGCGRCIAWCPVGIDITEEVQAIHEIPVIRAAGERRPSEKGGQVPE